MVKYSVVNAKLEKKSSAFFQKLGEGARRHGMIARTC